MILFSLKCNSGHTFESWFKSNEAYDSLGSSGMISCPVCGSANVEKNMMAPQLHSRNPPEETEPRKPKAELSKPKSAAEQSLTELRKYIEKKSEYVGKRFAHEARAIHLGDAPSRSIYGEAKIEEARTLLDEGVPVAPIPWISRRKSN